MVRLTNALLDLHLLEEGQLPLSLEPVDPNSIIAASLEQLRPMFDVHEIRAQADFQENLPALYVDWVVTQRVIENLIDNAIKFTPPGGEITLRSRQCGDDVVFSVKDSGPGIPNDQKQVMVERFEQLSFNEVIVQPGFGLGLAFCKLATDSMQGRIWVDTELGRGSTFYVSFPAYQF
jgi:signal transduction histidine kinase